MEKISKTEILKLMRNGWELVVMGGAGNKGRPGAWLQKDGDCKDIRPSTVGGMKASGMVVGYRNPEDSFFLTRFKLPL